MPTALPGTAVPAQSGGPRAEGGPMRIGMVSMGCCPAELAGPDCPLPALATALVEHGHEVVLLTRRQHARTPNWLRTAAFDIRQFDVGPAEPVDDGTATGLVQRFVTQTAAALDDLVLDVLHGHGWLAGLTCQLLPAAYQLPTVQSFGRLRLMEPLEPRRGPRPAAPGSRLRAERAVAVHTDHLIAGSTLECEALSRVGVPRSRISVIPSGVAAPGGDTAAGRRRVSGLTRVLVFALPTDVPDLVRAADGMPGTELVLCLPPDPDDETGSAERLGPQLAEEGAGRVRIERWSSTPGGREQLIRTADVVVCSAPSSLVGPVHLEAMALGVPVIADTPEAAEAVVDQVSGLRLAERGPAALAAMVRGLKGRPTVLESLSTAARDRVASRYGWNRIAVETARVYGRVLTCPGERASVAQAVPA